MNTRHAVLNTLVVLDLLIFVPAFASAATYLVAPSGSDSNPGTQAAPFATLQKAHDVAVAGDTIYMRGGTYNVSSQQTFTRDGSSGNHIKVFNYPGEVPILNASGITTTDTWVIRFNGASWWHIKGLEIKNNPKGGGITLSTTPGNNNNIIENNNFHHNGNNSQWAATGLSVYGSSGNNLILNNDSHHNKDIDNGDADGIVVFTSGTGNIVRGNRAWNNSDDGIDLWNASPVIVENNWSWNNGKDDAGNPLGNGNGFKLGGSGAGDGGHTLKNNLTWNNRAGGYDQNSADNPIKFYNNTAWNNSSGNFLMHNGAHIYKNNLSFGTLGSTSGSATYNSWNNPPAVTVDNSDFSSLDDTCTRGPRQADGSLPNCGFLRLAAASDVIDKGVDVGIAYSGSAPDLGAYEYGGSVPPPPPPSCAQTPLAVSSAASDGGFTYMILGRFGTFADNSNSPFQSTLRLFENGVQMGPAHALHVDIRNLGAGRFSHWSQTDGTGETLRLSASNNSDPRTNGKSYTYCAPASSVADTTPPTVPTGLTAVASASQVSLAWNASTDAVGVTGYRVYRNGTQIAAPASNSYIDGNLVPGTYSYTVAAVDAAGNVSAQSGIVSATIASPLLPPSRLRLDMPSPVSFDVTREEEPYRFVSILTVSPFPSPVQFEKTVTGYFSLATNQELNAFQRGVTPL
ncbi:MAG: right-handed parallel beta-helix repeat-containing protein [Gammaproteobacteria bacterium]